MIAVILEIGSAAKITSAITGNKGFPASTRPFAKVPPRGSRSLYQLVENDALANSGNWSLRGAPPLEFPSRAAAATSLPPLRG